MAQNNPGQQLSDLLVTRGYDPEMLDSAGKAATTAQDAEIFSFDFVTANGTNHGSVVVMLGDDKELTVFSGDNVGRNMDSEDKTEWYEFQHQLKNFATKNFMTFGSQNINKLKYSMKGQAALKEGLCESWNGTKNVSWNGGPDSVRLMIRHKRPMGIDEARFRQVESLFVETADGERYRLPFRNLAGGRAMVEHVRQGGRPYDMRGQHIATIIEELNVLSRFRRASKGQVFEGDTANLVAETNHYYETMCRTVKGLSSSKGYNSYFESWNPGDITEQDLIIEDIKTLFVQETIDSRIEQALPILARIQQQGTAMKEANIFEAWADRLVEGTWATPNTPEQKEQLIELLSTELPVGADATNATEQLYSLFGDDVLFDQLQELADADANADARELVIARMTELADGGLDSDLKAVLAALESTVPEPQAVDSPEVVDSPAPAPVAEGQGPSEAERLDHYHDLKASGMDPDAAEAEAYGTDDWYNDMNEQDPIARMMEMAGMSAASGASAGDYIDYVNPKTGLPTSGQLREFGGDATQFSTPTQSTPTTEQPPRRGYSIMLTGKPGKDWMAEYAWQALEAVFPRDYPGNSSVSNYSGDKTVTPAMAKILEVAKQGSAVVKTGITSEDIAETLVAKLAANRIPAQYWRVTSEDLDEGQDQAQTREVDAKGRTQSQWIQMVKAKFPDGKMIQSKMPDGPVQVTLPDGRRLGWRKVEKIDEILNPSSALAAFLRGVASVAGDLMPAALAGVATTVAASALVGPLAGVLMGTTAGSALFQAMQNQQNRVPGMLQKLIEKYFGSEAEQTEFLVLHAKNAYQGQSEFRWRGKQWPVTLRKNDAEAIIEKNDKYWLDAEKQKTMDAEKAKDDMNKEQVVTEGQGATTYTVAYKDPSKPGKSYSTQVKATSAAEAKAAFQEWDTTNRFTYLGSRPDVDTVYEEQGVTESAELNTMLKYAGIPVAESRVLDEAGETLDHILNRFKHEVKQFEQGHDLDSDLYEALFDYYSDAGELPYGIAKARTGDPFTWVSDQLAQHLGVNEGWKGQLAGGTVGGTIGTLAGQAVAGPLGAAVGGALGGTAGGMVGDAMGGEDQLNEVAPLLAAGARAIMPLLARVGPALGRMASGASKSGAEVAGKAATGIGRSTADVAKSAAQNADKIGIGLGAYQAITDIANSTMGGVGEVYRDAGQAAAAIAQAVGNAIDGKTVAELAATAVKYAIPIGILLAVLYGGKKLIDQVMSEGQHTQHGMDANAGRDDYEDEKLANIEPMSFKQDPIQATTDRALKYGAQGVNKLRDLFREDEQAVVENQDKFSALSGQYGHSGKLQKFDDVEQDVLSRLKQLAGMIRPM